MSNEHFIARATTIKQAIRRTVSSIRDLPAVAKAVVATADDKSYNLSYRKELADLLAHESIVLEKLMVALQVVEDRR